METKWTIFKLPPQKRDVYFVVPRELAELDGEVYCCPHDAFVCGCEAIINEGDEDPHGIFEFVRVIDASEYMTDGRLTSLVNWKQILPEAFEGQDA